LRFEKEEKMDSTLSRELQVEKKISPFGRNDRWGGRNDKGAGMTKETDEKAAMQWLGEQTQNN